MSDHDTVPLSFIERPEDEMIARATAFHKMVARRRTVRDFSNRSVPREVIAEAVASAATSPSGAHQQPWTFVCISDPGTKSKIRAAAEAEERSFYDGRAGDEWLGALKVLGTDWEKPFLETAPWLIAVFAQRWSTDENGNKIKHYYVPESVGIATGILITALHNAGLATLTHTPAPMSFLTEICGRPEHEKPYVLVVAGYPSKNCKVPRLTRKSRDEVAIWI